MADQSKIPFDPEELWWELDRQLKDKDLEIRELKLGKRSPEMKAAALLRETLESDSSSDEERLAAARGLLKLGRYQHKAVEVLQSLVKETEESSLKIKALNALSEFQKTIPPKKSTSIEYLDKLCPIYNENGELETWVPC